MSTQQWEELRNDPQFTAYALGELSLEDAKEYKEALIVKGLSEEGIRNEVANLQLLKVTLEKEFSKDNILRVSPEVREKIMSPTQTRRFSFLWSALVGGSVTALGIMIFLNSDTRLEKESSMTTQVATPKAELEANVLSERLVDKGAASAKVEKKMVKMQVMADSSQTVAVAAGAPQAFSNQIQARVMRSKSKEADAISILPAPVDRVAIGEQFNREAYDKIDVNPYTLVANEPLSTFSVDVDTASYANMRRYLLMGQLPPKDALRIEEMINYFPYDYKVDFKEHPVAIKVDQARSIWNPERKIVRIAMKSDSPSQLTSAPKNLVFLMDVSGSMNDPKKLPLLKESMKLLMRKLKKTDTISLVVYAGAAGVVLEPTEVREKVKILKALDGLSAGGSTNGGAGITAAYKMAKLGFVKNGVNRVILATDGDFNVGTSSRSSLVDLVEEKAKEDIFLTVVGLGMGNYQDATLEELSNRGNGNYAYIDSLQEANKLFNIDLEKNLTTVAKDVKVQVEFNPELVKAYRLIGYENRMLAAKDFNDDKKDAGEMGAGHTVTALYEVVPTGVKFDEGVKVDDLKYGSVSKSKGNNNELLTVKVRYKAPTGDKSTKFEVPLKNESIEFKKADNDFKFATAVASFGLKLRGDKLAKDLSYRQIEAMATEAKGDDPYDFRSEFVEMIDLASQIDK